MSQPTGEPQSGGPPSWQQQPQQPAPPPPPQSWQQPPQQPVPPTPTQQPSWTANLTSTTPVAGPAGFVYADVPNRMIAYIIDIIILAVINFVVSLVLFGIMGISFGSAMIVLIVNLVISIGYFVWCWSSRRMTVGMQLLGLQIGSETDGSTITTNQALVRWVILGLPGVLASVSSYWSDGLGFLLSLVGLIWIIALLVSIAQSPTKQGYHDRYAHTIMVKSARRAA
ncbi:MAG: RDD family protein [Candidatus Limnocylindrales bacterium]